MTSTLPFQAPRDWTVAAIAPSGSWDGTTTWVGRTIPTESATPHGTGWAYKAIGHFDTPPYQWFTSDFTIGVVCDHGDADHIDRVEFWLEGGSAIATNYTYNADTGAIAYCADVSVPAGTDGDVDIYAKIVPVNGLERLVGPLRCIFNKGGSITRTVKTVKASGGDYTNLATACAAASNGWIIKVDAGTYTLDGDGSYSSITRGYEVRPADGLSLGDVIINRSTRNAFRAIKKTPVVFRTISFESSKITTIYDLDHRIFIGCRFYDANGSLPIPGYQSGSDDILTFFRGDEGQQTYLVDCVFDQPMCAGWKFARNCTFNYSYDAWTIRYETNQTSDHVCIGCTATQVGNYAGRAHVESTLTVQSATYNAGTGRTTVVWSSSPSLSDVAAPASSDSKMFVLTGALASQVFQLYSQDNATDTSVVTGDASAMQAGDTAWTGGYAHCDTMQTFGLPGTFTYGNIIAQRYKTTGTRYQPIFLQTSSATGTHNGIACQLCLFVFTGGGDDESQLQNPCYHIVMRQCTHIGTDIEFRNDSTGWAAGGIVFDGCLFEDVLVASGGVLPSGITIRDCHFTSGSTWSSTNASSGDPLLDSNYRPSAISPAANDTTTLFPLDYHLRRWTGTVAKGACKGL